MLDRIAQIVLIILGILLLILLVIGLSTSCRVRPVPGSVTPAVPSPESGMTATPGSGAPPAETATNQPTPTPVVDPGLPSATSTPVSDMSTTAEVPPATETAIPSEPTAMPTTTPPSPEGTSAPPPTQDNGSGSSPFVPGTTIQHQVAQGEWLMQIARCYGTSYEAIRAANRLPYPDFILPGTLINVPVIGTNGRIIGPPCVVSYTIQSGDIWETLAGRFGTTVIILQKANPGGLVENRQIWVPRNDQ